MSWERPGVRVLKVLVLGGTTEASALARILAGDARFDPTLSLAGVTRAPRPQPVPVRTGGFGGVAGLVRHLAGQKIQALVDATHPFATQMTAHAALAAAEAGVPLLRIDRPAWQPGPGDRWRFVPSLEEAALALGEAPRRVLLTVGQKELAPFARAAQHHYLLRSVDAPDPGSLPPRHALITATGPFALEDERALLRQHRIEVLVSKNSGGDATAAKLAAARELGLPVILLARPAAPPGLPSVPDAAGATRWLLHRHASARRGV
jgi:precorrin-6A/cobalt-precorrin-6A reductase